MGSPFDSFAWFYERHWAGPFEEWQRPVLETLLIPSLPSGSRVLDLCCGCGTLARQLVAQGYRVIGVDSSDGMLRIARRNVPEAVFVHADASAFALESPVDGATCFFDSLNNLIDAERLKKAFACVHSVLTPGGVFLFDMNTRAAYGEQWNRSACEVQPDHAFFLRGRFDSAARIGYTQITMFHNDAGWQRADTELCQRPWEISEVEPLLLGSGFMSVEAFRAQEDLHLTGHYGIGRVYFRVRKSASGYAPA